MSTDNITLVENPFAVIASVALTGGIGFQFAIYIWIFWPIEIEAVMLFTSNGSNGTVGVAFGG